ncbi:MAG TPA: ABC-2 transporter permease [Tissierellia bacterium]|nr:ABC-2 transporter permease [Tissierellia bacterium]
MIGILKRDISLLISSKQMIIFMLFYIPLLLFVSESFVPEILYFMILVFYTYMMSTTSFTYDLTGKSKYVINSLPINRNELVIYKYLSIFIYFSITVVYAGVYLWIINILKLADVDYFNLRGIMNAIPTIMIYVSIVFPTFIRFEPRVAQIINIILFMTFSIISSNISYTGDKGALKYLGVLKWEYIMAIALVMYILSLLLSIHLYKNRDI